MATVHAAHKALFAQTMWNPAQVAQLWTALMSDQMMVQQQGGAIFGRVFRQRWSLFSFLLVEFGGREVYHVFLCDCHDWGDPWILQGYSCQLQHLTSAAWGQSPWDCHHRIQQALRRWNQRNRIPRGPRPPAAGLHQSKFNIGLNVIFVPTSRKTAQFLLTFESRFLLKTNMYVPCQKGSRSEFGRWQNQTNIISTCKVTGHSVCQQWLDKRFHLVYYTCSGKRQDLRHQFHSSQVHYFGWESRQRTSVTVVNLH